MKEQIYYLANEWNLLFKLYSINSYRTRTIQLIIVCVAAYIFQFITGFWRNEFLILNLTFIPELAFTKPGTVGHFALWINKGTALSNLENPTEAIEWYEIDKEEDEDEKEDKY